MPDCPAIHTERLVKTFGRARALNGLNLTVQTGEVHGFLGPNGAGKSTAIRILLGLLRADSGEVSLLGGDPRRDSAELHGRLAYVPGDVTLWPNLTGGEVIDLLTRLRGHPDAARKAELIERFDLDPSKKSRTYSKGNRQKVALVAAFVSDVELLILDEPTSGLDPLMEDVFKECIRKRADAGATILLSSHILSEVEQLCERVTIIRGGQTVETGTLDEMRHLTRISIEAEVVHAPAPLDRLSGLHDVVQTDNKIRCQVDADQLETLLQVLIEAGITSLVSHPPTLEELFLRHYRTAPEATHAQDKSLGVAE